MSMGCGRVLFRVSELLRIQRNHRELTHVSSSWFPGDFTSLSLSLSLYYIYIIYIEDSSEVNMRAFRFLPKENFKPLFHIRRADAFLSGIF